MNKQKELNDEEKLELRRNPPMLMTLQETAIYMQSSPDTIRRWVRGRKIRQYNLGTRKPLFATAELTASIKSRFEGGAGL